MRTRVREARPNVLSNERIPNTLAGVGPPSPMTRGRLPLLPLAGGLVVAIVTVLVLLLLR